MLNAYPVFGNACFQGLATRVAFQIEDDSVVRLCHWVLLFVNVASRNDLAYLLAQYSAFILRMMEAYWFRKPFLAERTLLDIFHYFWHDLLLFTKGRVVKFEIRFAVLKAVLGIRRRFS